MKKVFNKNKRIFLAALSILLSVTFAQAQGGQQKGQQGPPPIPDEEQIEEMVADLSKELSLSEGQEKKVSEAYFAHFDEVSEMTDGGNARPDREVMEQLRADFETEVKSYLDEDQQKQFDSYMKKQQSQRGGKGKPRQ